jgi:acyl-CoA synthetase (AMP-forming)/AMP-acid ligase II
MLPGVKLVQVYGMTETGFLTGPEAKEDTIGQLLTSCGRSCPGIDVQVVDSSSGRPVEAGQPGEIVARGANVMLGYWNHPDCSAQAFRNNFFRTGDIGYPGYRRLSLHRRSPEGQSPLTLTSLPLCANRCEFATDSRFPKMW